MITVYIIIKINIIIIFVQKLQVIYFLIYYKSTSINSLCLIRIDGYKVIQDIDYSLTNTTRSQY